MDMGLGALGLDADFVGVEVVQDRHARVEKDRAAGIAHCTLDLCPACADKPHACASNFGERPVCK